jgi:hypothetical protein
MTFQEIDSMTTQIHDSVLDPQQRQAMIDRKQAQLDAWAAEIDKLQARARQASADVREQTLRRLENLTRSRDEAFRNLSGRFHEFVNSQS